MSTASAGTETNIGVVGLLARLLVARGRNRADLCYTFVGTRSRLAEDCTFLNLGYWRDAEGYRAAGEALVDLLGEAAGIGSGDVVVDAGCGFGDQDLRWMQTRHPERIVALNVTDVQLDYARQHNAHQGIEYRNGSATSLPFGQDEVDSVVSLEAAFHFDSRETFLKEAFRVLKPGGRLGVVDMIPLEQDGRVLTGGVRGAIERWAYQVPTANVYGVTRYREILESCAFEAVSIQSIREHVFPGFLRYLRRLLADREAASRLHPLIRQGIKQVGDHHFAASDYVVISARKPLARSGD